VADKKTGCLAPLAAFVVLAVLAGAIKSGIENSRRGGVVKPPATSDANMEVGKQLAKDMATGEVILMAACMAKEGGIPRSRMGDYVAAAVEKQGITRAELYDNWDSKYWPLAKEAERRNRTSCLD
jgi:hypothetical protein